MIQIREDTRDYFKKISSDIKSGYVPNNHRDEVYGSGLQWVSHLFDIGAIRDRDNIFDIGCANGRLAMPLVDWNVGYTGFDINGDNIKFCEYAFSPWKDRFKFLHSDIYNEYYNPNGKILSLNHVFDLDSSLFDSVILCSVMTHICTEEIAKHYLSEVKRLLKENGRVWVTWFRSPPNEESQTALRTVLKESFIINLISDLGFKVIYTWNGFSPYWHDQWEMVLVKK